MQKIYFPLVNEDESATYEATLKFLDDYFIPKVNLPFERHLFRQIPQASDETVDRFVCKLRQRAASSDFGEFHDHYIRDQVIDKCYYSHLCRMFLEQESTLTLDGLLKVARAQEAVSRQLKETEGNTSSTGQVNAVGGKNSGGAKKPVSGKETRKSPRVIGTRRRSVSVVDKKDIFKGTRNAQRIIKPAESVEELGTSILDVRKVIRVEEEGSTRTPVLAEGVIVKGVTGTNFLKQISWRTSVCQPVILEGRVLTMPSLLAKTMIS